MTTSETPPAEPINQTPIRFIEDEMKQSYMDYAMSVIVGRALPDVRDGLKPVQRRVLYAMLGEGLLSNRKHSKCAGVVGEVLKRLHPHGDSSVYDALVRLAQHWSLRYPLVNGQGNFGSVDGDPAAAYRYTECRMSSIAERLLDDIEKETVDFIPNFDETSEEPVVLPTQVPNLLINGADGIAVGMATHIPPHNLGEVVRGTIELIKNPDISLPELMAIIPGPDFPTGGIIYGRGQIVSAYARGKGIISLRAKTRIETLTGKKDVQAIIIDEIPFQVNKAKLQEKIADLVNNKEIEGISKLRDESDRQGMRIVIELKKDATPEVVLNQLFKLTQLQTSFGITNLAIVEGKPMILGLHEMLGRFIDHRRDVVIRRTEFDLRKARERMHILEGFKIALINLDDVIALIRKAQTPSEARDGLCVKYSLSLTQSQAILDLRLQKLTGLERLSIEKEHAELAKAIEYLLGILADSSIIDSIIVAELEAVLEKYTDDRRTEILDDGIDIMVEDLIEDEDMVVTISHAGYVKRVSAATYKAQRRGGKGVMGAVTKEDDFTEQLFVASALSEIMFFTNLGRVYSLKVYEIPEASRTARGRALVNLLSLKESEKLTAVLSVREFKDDHFIVMATEQGIIKKSELSQYAKIRKTGVQACTLDEGDKLIGVSMTTSGDTDIVLSTKDGNSIRFNETKVRSMGRTARGVCGINLSEGDKVVGMTVVSNTTIEGEEEPTLLTITENGFGKRSAISEYRQQSRAGKGVIDIKTSERNGGVVSIQTVVDASEIMLITSSGKIIRIKANTLSVIGRNTQGVRLVGLDEGEKVVATSPLAESADDGVDA